MMLRAGGRKWLECCPRIGERGRDLALKRRGWLPQKQERRLRIQDADRWIVGFVKFPFWLFPFFKEIDNSIR